VTERSTAEVLRAARAQIADRKRWCRGDLAQDADGGLVLPSSPDARRFCALGALSVAEGSARGYEAALLLNAVSGSSIVALNDEGRWGRLAHRRVLAAYDAAIELAEASS
jgi:hypothetical protein